MSNVEFIEKCKQLVTDYNNRSMNVVGIMPSAVYAVWLSKVLQNNKALLSTTVPDGMYYEITYNGDKGEFYLDAYKKFENVCIKA